MSVFFYIIFVFFFKAGMLIISPFHTKARKWVRGRTGLFEALEKSIPTGEKIIWMHCASLGEFEQGRPLIERLRARFPAYKILLTFFSPSGYEVQKDYRGVDWVYYLPMDGSRNAKRFLEIVKPALVIFVKYEFWYYYLKKIKYRKIPLILISALFRKDMAFFKWYGGLQRKMLSRFDHIFVQNNSSKQLLDEIGLTAICSISGDTRFDRVIEISGQWKPLPVIEKFIGNSKAFVAGSTWPEDEILLSKAFPSPGNQDLKLIIAPHEVNEKHLDSLLKLFPGSLLYSLAATAEEKARVLIIDSMGLLSKIYRYADISYVGGGLKPLGVHNVLEAAVYGKPVLIGPFYKKYIEAVGLVKNGGAIVINNETELTASIDELMRDTDLSQKAGEASKNYVWSNKGATEKIIQFIEEKQILST